MNLSPVTPLESVANNLAVSQTNPGIARNDNASLSPVPSGPSLSPTSHSSPASSPSWSSYLVRGFVGTVTVSVIAITLPFFIVPWLPRRIFGALPYYATSARRIQQIFSFFPSSYREPGRRFIDLGSGDGVAVFVAADIGLDGVGIELNASLVGLSKFTAWRYGYRTKRTNRIPDTAGSTRNNHVSASASDRTETRKKIILPSTEEINTFIRQTKQSNLSKGTIIPQRWPLPPPLSESSSVAVPSFVTIENEVKTFIGTDSTVALSTDTTTAAPTKNRPTAFVPRKGHVNFYWSNLWSTDIHGYDIIMIFGVIPIMHRLEYKLYTEASPHAIIISHKFPLPCTDYTKTDDVRLNDSFIQIGEYDDMKIYARQNQVLQG